MVKFSVEMKKKDFVWVSLILILVCAGFGIAAWDNDKAMFHDSDDVKVTIDSVDYSLQEALDGDMIGSLNQDACTCVNMRDFASEVRCAVGYYNAGVCGGGENGRHNGMICCSSS